MTSQLKLSGERIFVRARHSLLRDANTKHFEFIHRRCHSDVPFYDGICTQELFGVPIFLIGNSFCAPPSGRNEYEVIIRNELASFKLNTSIFYWIVWRLMDNVHILRFDMFFYDCSLSSV